MPSSLPRVLTHHLLVPRATVCPPHPLVERRPLPTVVHKARPSVWQRNVASVSLVSSSGSVFFTGRFSFLLLFRRGRESQGIATVGFLGCPSILGLKYCGILDEIPSFERMSHTEQDRVLGGYLCRDITGWYHFLPMPDGSGALVYYRPFPGREYPIMALQAIVTNYPTEVTPELMAMVRYGEYVASKLFLCFCFCILL